MSNAIQTENADSVAHPSTAPGEIGYGRMLSIVARLSLRDYKRFMLGMFAAGVGAVGLELGAYGVILAAIAVLSDTPVPAVVERVLLNTSGQVQLATGAGAFFGLMLAAAGLHYLAGWLAATCRKRTFGDNITRTLQGLGRAPDHPFVRGRNAKEIARALRRDCRYSSLALTELINMPRPLVIAGLCVVAGFVFYPVIAAIALVILLVSVPVHLRTGRYGVAVMERLLSEGGRKGAADREAVETLLASPWVDRQAVETGHVEREDVLGFLDAYRDRVALAPVTQATSRIISTIVFAAVGAYMFWLFMDGRLRITDVAAIFIIFRIFNGASAEIVQKLVIIVSYSPIMKSLFAFFEQSGEFGAKAQFAPPDVSFDRPLEPGTAVFGLLDPGGPTRRLGEQLSAALAPESDAPPIMAVAAPVPADYPLEPDRIEARLRGTAAGLSEELRAELRAAARNRTGTDRALALLPILLSEPRGQVVVADSRSWLELSREDQEAMRPVLSGYGPVAVVYPAYPKRYPVLFHRALYARDEDTLIVRVAGEPDFDRRRQAAVAAPAPAGDAGTADSMTADPMDEDY